MQLPKRAELIARGFVCSCQKLAKSIIGKLKLAIGDYRVFRELLMQITQL
jgi:hypothetical protein